MIYLPCYKLPLLELIKQSKFMVVFNLPYLGGSFMKCTYILAPFSRQNKMQ